MENRALIALGLSFLVFLVFMYVGEKTRGPQAPLTKQAQQAVPEKPAASPAPAKAKTPAPLPVAAPAAAPARPAKDIVVETPLYRAVFTEAGARLKSFQLTKYSESLPFTPITKFSLGSWLSFDIDRYHAPNKTNTPPKELVRPGPSQDFTLGLNWQGKGLTVPDTIFYEASQPKLVLKDGDKGTLKFTGVSPEGLTIVKTFTFKADNYVFNLKAEVANHTGQTLTGHLDLDLSENFAGEESSRFHFLGYNGSVNHKSEEIKSGGLKKPQTFNGKVEWASLDEGYFLTAMVPETAPNASVQLQETPPGSMVASLRTPVDNLAVGQGASFAYALYFGPKAIKDLEPLGLEKIVNFGWFDFLGKPLLYVLRFFNRYTHNYGWDIIILTILIRILFFYPNHKSYKSMKDMQKLQPKVAKLKEKYKDDKETMNKELMGLYRTFKVNPLAGCLPMVIQLPVFIALYNVLGYAIELRHASFLPTLPFTNIVWLADLSTKDPLLITPIIMGATMFIQQKMTPSAGDPTQAKMMMFLPLIFTFMFLNFASGLVVYWLVNNVLSIVQQHYTNKYLT